VASNDSIKKTITVALLLCIVCSVVVSTASVVLKPAQEANKQLDFKRNILSAAGLLEEGKSIDELFSKVETKIVDMNTGEFTDEISPNEYDSAMTKSGMYKQLSPEEDVAGIMKRANFAKVYLVKENGKLKTLVLPVSGYGLWGTMYGFLALGSDLNSVSGLGFYDHKETPGLGAEIDNPRWQALWEGKEIYGDSGNVALDIIKGSVAPGAADAEHKIDGLSGATLTSNGVDNMIQFWMGANGYRPFLNNLKAGEA